ncbi:sodium:proton antiporter [Ahrensia sp. R2A130]|uniref:cation:proton antiporter n=1 Tax=Ahrensia sp. R2A130 TaxID=744979 RepID=UPI0001E0C9B9|nr:sodium:proton antiporter [Ahrensia sp. R2A130]EFL90826.1 sodium/hydrogen exchanger [Ahrensia sp. R2A130]
MDSLPLQIAVIGAAGIAAQWVAWRLRIPAIALLLVAGFLLGPVFGYLDPKGDFGDLYKPVIGLAVAIVLFEGGLTLNFSEIRETEKAVRRVILIGGPLVWIFSTLAAHYAAGLPWGAAAVLGGILVVTGPTVIMPLLRQAQLSPRPASLLRWEAIVNDPIGALFAVLAFQVYLVLYGDLGGYTLAGMVVLGAIVAVGGGLLLGRAMASVFARGLVPDFLKAPVLLAVVLLAFSVSNLILEESGLLTVTIMGITMANSKMASLTELRRFKETVTVLLVSGLFIMLTASLRFYDFEALGWGAVVFVFLILFVARPIAIMLATIGSGIDLRERFLISWIAPRGIVAVAVAGLFGAELADSGVAAGNQLVALTFLVVAATILLHGFSLGPLASALGLKSAERPGLLIVGGSSWTQALAEKLQEMKIPVLIADGNWNHIRKARLADVPVFYGDVLSESAHHDIIFNRYSHILAATDNDAYNSLVCTEYGPEIGRNNVFQIGNLRNEKERNALRVTLGGRQLFDEGKSLSELRTNMWQGWTFQNTRITDEFSHEDYRETRAENTETMFWVKPNGDIHFKHGDQENVPELEDVVMAFGPTPKNGGEKKNKAAKVKAEEAKAVDAAADEDALEMVEKETK